MSGKTVGEYGNGGATSTGRTEYIWLPTDDGSAIPIALFRNNRYYNIHSDHLGTPRLVTDDQAKPVWQWSYSAFGDNKPTGILKATTNPNAAITNQPVLLQATGVGTTLNLRFPGQYADSETGLFYNYFRSYQATQGRYTQNDPIGLASGSNRVVYGNANALNNIDPLGLWSIGFELYGGIGGGVTFTCSDGKMELISRLGTGVGGGFGFDPLQGASPHSVGSAGSIGRTFGTIGAEAKIPTLSVGAAATVRTGNAVTTKVGGGYTETSLPQFGMGNWQAKLSYLAAFGVEFGGYIDSKLCTCK